MTLSSKTSLRIARRPGCRRRAAVALALCWGVGCSPGELNDLAQPSPSQDGGPQEDGALSPDAVPTDASPTAAGMNWVALTPATSPPEMMAHASVYDAARGEVVVFGGRTWTPVYINATWIWDGTTWQERAAGSSPPPRSQVKAALAYDAAREEVVLFGGCSATTGDPLADTWVWNGTAWTQKQPASAPPGRCAHAMAYDAARGEVILFGGITASGRLNDTWAWDGSTWSEISSATKPAARGNHSLTFDAARQEVMLYGGKIDADNSLGDTWVWNGTTWSERNPPASPGTLNEHGATYDAASQLVIIFGGFSGSISTSTWAWNGTTWTNLAPATVPLWRMWPSIAYDAAREEIVLFGGGQFSTQLRDTWVFRATDS